MDSFDFLKEIDKLDGIDLVWTEELEHECIFFDRIRRFMLC